ncbi:hypothetical protein BCR32DRAFT_266031 [Anaeromyces robustus]|uniref:Periplasmic binding protein-like II n=1 Tax=Anaeromyces robustus TaxID=1754192 RepID=A0A1Y1XHM5_9FUNG|nr:hypothetical protein BCR32DRAFT_266031 [Anaeromyces robustus]|eukprot:ORX84884.1 hypothetical protein BCR32DRAFT_266031 [Anaeromyces robustus]
MYVIKQCFINLFIFIINIKLIYSTTIHGYFYNIFPKNEISTKNVIESYFENNKKEFGINPDINLIVTVSNSTNYEDYIDEVKKEIKQSKYHFFLIDYNSLFGDYSYYHDGKIDLINNFDETKLSPEKGRIVIPTKELDVKDFYSYTIPLNKYLKYDDEKNHNSGYLNYRIYEDCQLNNNYYAYPFSASYDLLFYNKKYFKKLEADFNKLENWSDIERIILEYQQKKDNTKYGINLGLDSPRNFMSFLLEYFHIINNESYNECATGYLQSKNSKSNKIIYYDYNKCGLGYDIFYEDNIKKEGNKEHIFRSIKQILNNHIINPNSLSYNESQAFENFLNGESIFFKGNYSSFIDIVKRIYLSSNDSTLSSSSNSLKNDTINSILQNINLTTENIFKENDQFGVTVLPNGYSTYSGYALIGNNHINFTQLYYDITQIIALLTSEKAQMDRSINYNISPAFNYNSIEEEESSSPITTMCQSIPCNIYKKIKPISLTKSFLNKETANNDNIFNNFYEFFKKYYYEGDDILLQNVFLDKIKVLLKIHYIKWDSFAGIFSIVFGLLAFLYCIILIYLIFKYRENIILKESYPLATIIYIFGFSFFVINPIINIVRPISQWVSVFKHYYRYFSLTITFCAYLYKLWKINIKINKNELIICGINLLKIPILIIILTIFLIQLFINILWDIVSRDKYIATFYYNKSTSKFERLAQVVSKNSSIFYFLEDLTLIVILYSLKYDQEARKLIFNSVNFISAISISTLTVLPKILEVIYTNKSKN